MLPSAFNPRPWLEFHADPVDVSPLAVRVLDSSFCFKHYDKFTEITQRRTDADGTVAFHNVYLVYRRGEPTGDIIATANIDAIIPAILDTFGSKRALMFRLENNFPKFAQGCLWKWPGYAGIVVSRFPGLTRMQWFACFPFTDYRREDLVAPDALSEFLSKRNGPFESLFYACAEIYREAAESGPKFYVTSALNGAFAGLRAAYDKEYRRALQAGMQDWTPLLEAITDGSVSRIDKETYKLGYTAQFVVPYFLEPPDS